MKLPLYAPKEYWSASQEELDEVCNGCGSKDGIKVPDTIYGLSIKIACDIHL